MRPIFLPSLWVAAALLGAALLSYAGAYQFPLVFDDVNVIGKGAPAFGARWLSMATFAIAADQLELQRLVNVLLHAATVIAIFHFCRELVRRGGLVRDSGHADLPALAAAAAFALHPVTVYGVAYLAQRSIVMATLFSVLALYAWLRGLRSGDWRWFVAFGALYALALLSKEHAVMLPAVALALALADRESRGASIHLVAAALLAPIFMACMIAWEMRGVVGAAYEPRLEAIAAAGEELQLRSMLTQALLYLRYLATWLMPLPGLMSIDVRWDLAPSALAPAPIFGAIAFLGYGAAVALLIAAGGRRALIGFAALLPWLFYFTEFAAVRMAEPFVLYRSYLWGVGLAVLCAVLGVQLRPRTLLAVALTGCVLGAIGMRERLATFETPVALWDDAVRKLPAAGALLADRAIGNRGVALMRAGRLEEARRDLDRAVDLNPRSPVAFFNRAMLLAFAGDIPRAQADLREAQRLQREK